MIKMGFFKKMFGKNYEEKKEDCFQEYLDVKQQTLNKKEEMIETAIYMNKSMKCDNNIHKKKMESKKEYYKQEAEKYKSLGDEEQTKMYLYNAMTMDKNIRQLNKKICGFQNIVDFKLEPLKYELNEHKILIEHARKYNTYPSKFIAETITSSVDFMSEMNEVGDKQKVDYEMKLKNHIEKRDAMLEKEYEKTMDEVNLEIKDMSEMEEELKNCSVDMKETYNKLMGREIVESERI
jgi:hypothetical protein